MLFLPAFLFKFSYCLSCIACPVLMDYTTLVLSFNLETQGFI